MPTISSHRVSKLYRLCALVLFSLRRLQRIEDLSATRPDQPASRHAPRLWLPGVALGGGERGVPAGGGEEGDRVRGAGRQGAVAFKRLSGGSIRIEVTVRRFATPWLSRFEASRARRLIGMWTAKGPLIDLPSGLRREYLLAIEDP